MFVAFFKQCWQCPGSSACSRRGRCIERSKWRHTCWFGCQSGRWFWWKCQSWRRPWGTSWRRASNWSRRRCLLSTRPPSSASSCHRLPNFNFFLVQKHIREESSRTHTWFGLASAEVDARFEELSKKLFLLQVALLVGLHLQLRHLQLVRPHVRHVHFAPTHHLKKFISNNIAHSSRKKV